MDVGTLLHTARERAALSLPQISANTKIPLHTLRAIEENAFDRVPRGIFIRSFIRAYAREVKLDPDALVAQFVADDAPGDLPISLQPSEPDLSESGPSWAYVLIVSGLLAALASIT
jgi:cytoskeleton protein RodZ